MPGGLYLPGNVRSSSHYRNPIVLGESSV